LISQCNVDPPIEDDFTSAFYACKIVGSCWLIKHLLFVFRKSMLHGIFKRLSKRLYSLCAWKIAIQKLLSCSHLKAACKKRTCILSFKCKVSYKMSMNNLAAFIEKRKKR